MLYKLCRILLTELINRSYSQEYIYLVVNEIFYNIQSPVKDAILPMEEFWAHFNFKKNNYKVTLPLKQSKLINHLRTFQNVDVKENNQNLFGNSCKWILEIEVDAMDPENARKNANTIISFFVSLLQYNNHNNRSFHTNDSIVTEAESNKRYRMKTPIALLKKGTNLSSAQINAKINSMIENLSSFGIKMFNAIELHSSAIESNDVGNQRKRKIAIQRKATAWH
jgi:hypothetical protein